MAHVVFSLFMAVVPAIVLLVYFYRKDKNKPEPAGMIFKVFFWGIFSIIPVLVLEGITSHFAHAFVGVSVLYAVLKAFLVAGLCEEYCKLVVVKQVAYKNPHFDDVMDGIVYAVVASLGFACLENVMYVMSSGLFVAVMRAFTAVPGHALFTGIMGYYIGRAKFAGNPKTENHMIRKGFWIAVGLHGLYDFFLFLDYGRGLFALLVFPALLIYFVILKRLIKSALSDDVERLKMAETLIINVQHQ